MPAPPPPPTLRSVLEPVLQLPEKPFAARHLADCCALLEAAQRGLLTRAGADETIQQQNRVLLAWLAGVYHAISGSQALISGDLLQPEMVASGMLAPFVQPAPPAQGDDGAEAQPAATGGAAKFGVPSSTAGLCDSASELLRMAGAALASLYIYLNFRQGPDDLPCDEVTLMFTTVAVNSVANAGNAATIDGQIHGLVDESGPDSVWTQLRKQQEQEQAGEQEQQQQEQQPDAASSPPPFGCAEIRWLMHWCRGLVSHHMAAVAHVLDDEQQQADCYHAQQKDAQYLCMVLPSHPLGYSMFARCAMNGQAMPLAAAFLQRGLAAARAAGADSSVTAMAFQRAAALLLGGGGPKVDAAEVQALLQEGEDARNGVLVWWPEPWQAAAEDGEPDRSLVLEKLLPELERRTGAPLPAEGSVPALAGLLYVTRPPSSVPAGAVQHVLAAGHEVQEE